jgi:hypothetical protein
MFFDHVIYEDTLLTISAVAELAILYFVFKEGRQVVANVRRLLTIVEGEPRRNCLVPD